MKKANVLRFELVAALLLTVNMNANAQLGGLLNKAKKAVTQETGQTAQEKRNGYFFKKRLFVLRGAERPALQPEAGGRQHLQGLPRPALPLL